MGITENGLATSRELSPPASRASAGTTIPLGFVNDQPAAVGNDRWCVSPVSGLLFTGNAATLTCRAVGARSADLSPSGASPGIFSVICGRRSGVRALAVTGRAFRTRDAVTACRLKESQ